MTNRRFINRHWQRAISHFPRKIGAGFSLIEALVVTGISTIVMSSVLGVVAHQYQVQKRLALLQDFATESQFLVERITQLVRNNTIDYDRYFVEIGPDATACTEFSADQTDEAGSSDNDQTNRANIGYERIFFWDTNSDDTPDTYLGGLKNNGAPDPCAQAFSTVNNADENPTLFLVNGQRTIRTALVLEDNRFKLSRQWGADTDNDQRADLWGVGVWDADNKCKIEDPAGTRYLILATIDEQYECENSTYDPVAISPPALSIKSWELVVTPDRDPYLAFRDSTTQKQPLVISQLTVQYKDWAERGFDQPPEVTLQSSASSRIFGSIR